MPASPAKPYTIRRAALISFAKGASGKSINKRFDLANGTVAIWAKGAGIAHGSQATPMQVEAHIARQRESMMQEDLDLTTDDEDMKAREAHITMTHGPGMAYEDIEDILNAPPDAGEVAAVLKAKAEKRKNMQITEKSTLKKAMDELMDPSEFEKYLQARFAQIVARIDQEATLEGQVNAVVAGGLLTSIAAAIRTMPMINTWADFERAVKLLRLTLNMDENKGVASNGADLSVLNQAAQFDKKSRRSKIVDIPA